MGLDITALQGLERPINTHALLAHGLTRQTSPALISATRVQEDGTVWRGRLLPRGSASRDTGVLQVSAT